MCHLGDMTVQTSHARRQISVLVLVLLIFIAVFTDRSAINSVDGASSTLSSVKGEDPAVPFDGLPLPYIANSSNSVLKHLYECDPRLTDQWMSKHVDQNIQKVFPADKLFGKRILFLGNSHTRQLYILFVSTFLSFVTHITRNRVEHITPFEYIIEGKTNVFDVSFTFQSKAVIVYNSPLFYQPNVSKLEEHIGSPFEDFDIIVLGYINPTHHCRSVLKDCPKGIQMNLTGIASHFRKDVDLIMVNMFGRDKILHEYKVPTRSSEQDDRSYFPFQDKVHQNYSFVDVNEVPSLCSHKNCKNTEGHQCNNPGPPNMVVWHLIDCMKPFRKSS